MPHTTGRAYMYNCGSGLCFSEHKFYFSNNHEYKGLNTIVLPFTF